MTSIHTHCISLPIALAKTSPASQPASTNGATQLALGRIASDGVDGSVAAQLLRTGTWLSRDQAEACLRLRQRSRVRARADALRLWAPKSFRETW